MDLWIVAAATGAGYIAKHLKHLSKEKDESLESVPNSDWMHGQAKFRNVMQELRERTYPLRRLTGERVYGIEDVLDERYLFDGHREAEMASTCGSNNSGSCHDYDIPMSLDILHRSGIQEYEHHQAHVFDSIYDRKGELGDMSGWYFPAKDSSFHSFNGNRHPRMVSHGYALQPIIPGESFLTAQTFNEDVRMESSVLGSLALPAPEYTARPLLVSNDGRIIGRASNDSLVGVTNGEERLGDGEETPSSKSQQLQIRLNHNNRMAGSRRTSISRRRASDGSISSQESSSGVLFFLGLTLGMMSSVVSSQKEVDKLNEMLKQSENLIQDLHEELEMKDQLNVREIHGGSSRYIGTDESSPRKGKSTTHSQDQEKFEAMRKIEAELEAELERLELSMNTTSLEKISDFVELDSDLEVDVIEGNVNLEKLPAQPGVYSDSDDDVAGTSDGCTYTPNYAVSPRALTLRLHQVIQGRLEARIVELEAALEDTQKKLDSKLSESRTHNGDMIREPDRLSGQGERPHADYICKTSRPVVMNLTDEALDAYNEALEEIDRNAETDEEAARYSGHAIDRTMGERHHFLERILLQGQDSVPENVGTFEEWTLMSRESNNIGANEDNDDDDGELRKLLVEHIRRKQWKVQQ